MATTEKTLDLWRGLIGSSAPDDTFRFKECRVSNQDDNSYVLTWEKIGPTKNSLTEVQMQIKFDYGSFSRIFQRLQPKKPLTEFDVAWTIGYFFEEIGHKVLVFGRDHYEELAERIVESTGLRMLWDFGIK